MSRTCFAQPVAPTVVACFADMVTRDSTFISANCFATPAFASQPRPWQRIAVPSSSARHSDRKIYKRVSTKPCFDKTYHDVLTELESQSFGQRKRARTSAYIRPYSCDAPFKKENGDENSGTQDLALARGKS